MLNKNLHDLKALKDLNKENSYAGGIYDFIDYDGEWFLVIKTFIKVVEYYILIAEKNNFEDQFKGLVEAKKIITIKEKYGRRVPLFDRDLHKFLENTYVLIDQFVENNLKIDQG